MEKLIFLVFSLISLVNCNDFIVVSSPKSIVFKGSNDLPANALSEIYTASLGYSINADTNWDGLQVENPFRVAKAAISVIVEDANELSFGEGQKFSMIGGDEDFEETVHAKILDHSHLAVNVDLVNRHNDHISTVLGELKKSPLDTQLQFLKTKEKGDREFLEEIEYLTSLTEMIESMKTLPAFISVRLSMKSLSKTSSARSEANKLFISKINKLNEVVQKKYNDNALFTVVAVDEHIPHHRIRRQVKPLEEVNDNPYNIASLSGSDYPVIFNIILWFTLVFVFALIAISLALSNVEDKDSIIYRMTGSRGKKEN